MTFQPVVPLPGIAGWTFLQRTYDNQFDAFTKAPSLTRDADYFRENIASITTASELVSDRRLLSVALDAFGLSEDINNRAFLQRILEDGTSARDALANRLADERYKKFSDAFGFGPNQSVQTATIGFEERIVDLYKVQQFEVAVGQQDETMRIALFAQRELADLAQSGQSKDAQWFSIMGVPPLRTLMETALGLPTSFAQLDIDKQRGVFQEKARLQLGSDEISDIVRPEALKQLTNAYLARAQINSVNQALSSASVALTLLQNSQNFQG